MGLAGLVVVGLLRLAGPVGVVGGVVEVAAEVVAVVGVVGRGTSCYSSSRDGDNGAAATFITKAAQYIDHSTITMKPRVLLVQVRRPAPGMREAGSFSSAET